MNNIFRCWVYYTYKIQEVSPKPKKNWEPILLYQPTKQNDLSLCLTQQYNISYPISSGIRLLYDILLEISTSLEYKHTSILLRKMPKNKKADSI